MQVKQQEGSFLLLNAVLPTAETDYTKFKETANKKKKRRCKSMIKARPVATLLTVLLYLFSQIIVPL